jgi:hypothetical protein
LKFANPVLHINSQDSPENQDLNGETQVRRERDKTIDLFGLTNLTNGTKIGAGDRTCLPG